MFEYLLSHEAFTRLVAFLLLAIMIAMAEYFSPRRAAVRGRWPTNLALLALDGLMVRMLSATSLIGMAAFAGQHDLGVLRQLRLPAIAQILLSVIALDLVLYVQHRLLHSVPMFWRFHAVHHADSEFDVTTGVRFHPLEAVFSFAVKAIAVIACGAPLVAVLLFEVLLNAASLFGHSNIRLAANVDHALRLIVVTPDMHRIHHSVQSAEREHNFGFFTSIWDRLFGTYQAQPALSHATMMLGLPALAPPAQNSGLWALLCMPFMSAPSEDPGKERGKEPGN